MAISMVRQPSETPNVTNIDDIIPFRYAYGDQNGYVIGKGQELSYTINGRDFRVNSGRVVLNGVESDVDANGVTFTIDNASETRYYVVYYQVNLATNTTDILLSNFSTTGYPVIDIGEDLTTNPSGLARMELYRFTTSNGVIGNVEKIVNQIKYMPKFYKDKNGVLKLEDIIIPQKKLISADEFTFGSYIARIPLNIDCSKDVKIKFDISFEIGAYDMGTIVPVYTENLISYEIVVRNQVITDNHCITYYRNFVSGEGKSVQEICFGTFSTDCENNTLGIWGLNIYGTLSAGVDQSRTAKITNIYQIIE